MESLWVTEIEFKPTGPLTFRQMPSGILHIMSYPFMPPTTMSGFLKRLLNIAGGNDWNGYGEDWYGKCWEKGKEYTLTLGREYRPLGAFPKSDRWTIHKTRRHGPKDFEHGQFSKLLRTNNKDNYQLHHWDYLFCESLTGWVAAANSEPLQKLSILDNFGGKCGKEGWVFVNRIEEPRQVPIREGEYRPLGLVTPPDRPSSGQFFNIYGHFWDDSYEWKNGEKGGVTGFTQLGCWWNVGRMHGRYWEWDDGRGFPAHIPDVFIRFKN